MLIDFQMMKTAFIDTYLKWSCKATRRSKESPLSAKPIPMDALRPVIKIAHCGYICYRCIFKIYMIIITKSSQRIQYYVPPSWIRKTKYRLESKTCSTATPGYSSTGHWANGSPV